MFEHRFVRLTVFGAGLVAAVACLASPPATAQDKPPPPPPPPAATAAAPTEAASAIVQRACQACHDLGVITQASHTADEWPVILQRMRSNGANLTDAEFKQVQAYLVQNYSATQ